MFFAAKSRKIGCAAPRGGVVLLIMLGMLALFTLIAATFVISAGHFRRGATAASRAEQMGDSFEVLLQQALMQVVRGSNNPQSVIGPHSLLEDLYGNADSVGGMVVETSTLQDGRVDMGSGLVLMQALGGPAVPTVGTQASFYPRNLRLPILSNNRPQDLSPMLLEISGVGFGWDKEPGIALVDDDGNGVVDDVTEAFAGDDAPLGSTFAHPVALGSPPGKPAADAWATKQLADGTPLPIIDNVDNYYAGRVITFLSGEAAGKSSHIVRSKAVPLPSDTSSTASGPRCVTMLWVQPLHGDVRPTTRDRFIINGRPFNGTGFGYSPYQNNAARNLQRKNDIRFLRRLDMGYVNPVGGADPLVGVPIALLPNPTDPGYREYLEAAAPLVDADEDYDAPDYQNMLISYRAWNGNRYETIMPSLHRPDLVNYFVRNLGLSDWTQLPPRIRRRIILRPEPADHYDYTQESTLDPSTVDGWNPAESFTDTNRNGQWDPGEPFQDRPPTNNAYDTGDRTFAANAFDPVLGPWDVDNDGDGRADSIWVDLGMPVTTLADGRAVKPLFAILVADLDGRLNYNAHGSTGHYFFTNTDGNPIDNPSTAAPRRGATEERYILGSGVYFADQSGTSNAYSPRYYDPTKHHLKHPETEKWVPATKASTGYATKYLWDEPSYGMLGGDSFEPQVGSGYSVADVNLAAMFVRNRYDFPTLPQNSNAAAPQFVPRHNRYRALLEGTHLRNVWSHFTSSNNSNLNGTNFPDIIGRYGEVHLMPQLMNTTAATQIYPGSVGPRPGLADGSTIIPGARLNLPGDDDSPGAPTPFRNGGGAADRSSPVGGGATGIVALGNTAYDALVLPDGTLNIRSGVWGTPGDPDANGFIALDFAGRPIYQNMGVAGETVNEPWEINLVNRYRPRARSGSTPVEIDANFTPGELANALHIDEFERATYDPRLRQVYWDDTGERDLAFGVTTEQWDIPCPHIAPTAEMSWALRALGLPLNNPSLGDLLRAKFFLAHGAQANNKHQVGLYAATRLATASMRSYRFHGFPGQSASGSDDLARTGIPVGWQAFCNNVRSTHIGFKRRNVRLISPDLVVGLKMNVNAPLGNGYDDDGDGVVDELGESMEISKAVDPSGSNNNTSLMPTQPLWSAKGDPILPGGSLPTGGGFAQYAQGGLRCDSNRDGNYDGRMDEMAHQQQAKELYCLMMLLMDQNYVIPAFERQIKYDNNNRLVQGAEENPQANFGYTAFKFPDPPRFDAENDIPTFSRAHRNNARAWLTARQIAQWAINAVDFRDRDSIMTPFEFDVDPFFDNDGDCTGGNAANLVVERPNCNGTWDVDGMVTDDPVELLDPANGFPDSQKPWRGLVWGCEYPDLILTETLAFHDRRTQNIEGDTTLTTTQPMLPTDRATGFCLANRSGNLATMTTGTCDPHWDQARMPQGSLFVELYATGNPHLALKGAAGVNSALPRELYFADGRLNLSKVVSNGTISNPVWRLLITKAIPIDSTMHPNNIALRAARKPSTCSFNPFETYGVLPDAGATRIQPNFNIVPPGFTGTGTANADDPQGIDYKPVTFDRVVAFCAAGPDATPEAVFKDPTDPPDVFFYRDSTNQQAVGAAPGDYVVVGPHRRTYSPPPQRKWDPMTGALIPYDAPVPPPEDIFKFDNITTIGSTITHRFYEEIETTCLTGTTGTNPHNPAFQLHALAYANPNSPTVNPTDLATADNYREPPPIIEMGLNCVMGGSNSMPSRAERPFVVTNMSGVDEYPRPSMWPVTASLIENFPDAYVPAVPATQITNSRGLVLYPLSPPETPPGQVTDTVGLAQIRRPIVVPCAIVDAKANFGEPVGLNISEPRVATGQHAAVYDISRQLSPANRNLIDAEYTTIFSSTDDTKNLPSQPPQYSPYPSGAPPLFKTISVKDTWTWKHPDDPSLPDPPPQPEENTGPIPDEPFDGFTVSGTTNILNPEFGKPTINTTTGALEGALNLTTLRDATYLNVRTVFLQRLADPTRVWNVDNNPYITIDWMPIDLTIFNGSAQKMQEGSKSLAMHTFDPDNPPYVNSQLVDSQPTQIRFGTRQRGNPARPILGRYSNFDLWTQPNWLDTFVTDQPNSMSNWYAGPPPTRKVFGGPVQAQYFKGGTGASFPFQHPLQHTLGYLNVGYHVNRTLDSLTNTQKLNTANLAVRTPFVRPLGTRPPPAGGPGSANSIWDVGWYTGYDLCRTRSALAMYIGSPRRPFTWLAWNNRPYASAMELMMVPCTGPSRWFHDYDMRRTAVFPFTSSLPALNPGVPPFTGGVESPNPTNNPMFLPDERRRSANEYLPYLQTAGVSGASSIPDNKYGYAQAPPYRYLLNFFTSSVSTPALAPNLQPLASSFRPSDVQSNFFRIFEFVTVPSKFSGTRQMHIHGRFTHRGLFEGVWNNAAPFRTIPLRDALVGATPPGAPNPGTQSIHAADLEHPGWPFTAPNNMISLYREPGRVNVNTIPLLAPGMALRGSPAGEKVHDYGAAIWRGVTNEFFPMVKEDHVAAKHVFRRPGVVPVQFRRAIDLQQNNFLYHTSTNTDWESPSEDYVDNFYAMFSGMRSDWPVFDIRGRNAAWELGNDDLMSLLNDERRPPPSSRTEHQVSGFSPKGRMDPQKPAWIANPIRSFLWDYAASVPQFNFANPYMNPLPQPHESAYQRMPYLAVDGTLLRRKDTTWLPWKIDPWNGNVIDNVVQGNTGSGQPIDFLPQTSVHIDPIFDPLFALNFPRPTNGVSGSTVTMYDPQTLQQNDRNGRRATQWMKSTDYRNTDRNPFFRYQLYTKLGSVVTTRSNVYAIWITLGMFECERVGSTILPSQNGFDPGEDFPMEQRFPDGFRILREVGGDTGELKRHKMFAIFDRSIPVGFKRGENYNVDRAFLVRHIAY